jgi:antitoxin (DNA-binding transcriptional repressor) of toxin-antitoxin stability system
MERMALSRQKVCDNSGWPASLRRRWEPTPRSRLLDEVATGSYFLGMRTVGIKVLKNKLSQYVRAAAAGETVLVTDRDRVVAELVPPQPDRNRQLEDEFIARGVREGWLTPATILPGTPLPPRKPVMSHDELMRELDSDREDRF